MVDAGGEAAKIGENLLVMTGVLFESWYKVRDGTRKRRWLQRRIEELIRPEVQAMLRQGSRCSHAPSAGTCAAILGLEEALWTFAYHEGVEPTNNAAERALRPAVLKRKKSFGNHSAAGCEYVARLLRGYPVSLVLPNLLTCEGVATTDQETRRERCGSVTRRT
jgi:transposase